MTHAHKPNSLMSHIMLSNLNCSHGLFNLSSANKGDKKENLSIAASASL